MNAYFNNQERNMMGRHQGRRPYYNSGGQRPYNNHRGPANQNMMQGGPGMFGQPMPPNMNNSGMPQAGHPN